MEQKSRKEDYEKVKSYYLKAKSAIDSGNEVLASRIIFGNMPRELYDLSLDILYNYNSEFASEETRSLVKYVDKKLSTISLDTEDDDTNLDTEEGDNEVTFLF